MLEDRTNVYPALKNAGRCKTFVWGPGVSHLKAYFTLVRLQHLLLFPHFQNKMAPVYVYNLSTRYQAGGGECGIFDEDWRWEQKTRPGLASDLETCYLPSTKA